MTINAEPAIQTTPTAALGMTLNAVAGTTADATIAVASAQGIPIAVAVSSVPAGWLTITQAPATANSTAIAIAANTGGLQANTTYAGQVTITSAAASNSPYTIPVTLKVTSVCAFTLTGGNTATLPSTGTSTAGALPEVPLTVGITAVAGTACTTSFTAVSSAWWLTATAGGSSVSYSALSNPHSTAQSATLTIANSGGGSQTFTVKEAASTAPQLNRQVTALYQTVLGRDPDASGLAYWTGTGATGGPSALGEMLDSFLTAPEAYNTDFAVIAAYQAAGAPPTYAQFTAAVTAVRAGTQTIGGLFGSLIAGKSYSAATLYQNLLNRAPTSAETNSATQAGLTAWFQNLIGFPASNTTTTADNEFQTTGTFQTTGVDHTNALYIRLLYFLTLGRDPDPTGLTFWTTVADSGGGGILFQGGATMILRVQIEGPAPGQGFTGGTEFQALYQ